MTESTNKVFCGDNLDILKTLESESIDLVYIDPPFFTSRNYEVVFGDNAEIRAFEDRWVKMGENGRYSKDINIYLEFMQPRIQEIYRIMRKTASFYLHCDYHADSYLRILCDQIFGYENLINQIIWVRTTNSKGTNKESRKYGCNTDTILLYAKTSDYLFKIEKIKLSKLQEERDYSNIEEETNRRFTTQPFKGIKGPKKIHFHDQGHDIILQDEIGFRWSQETYEKRISENPYCIYWSKTDNPRMKIYLDEHEGVSLSNFWNDINIPSGKERLGYPTQKPEALLERIIKASSNENDIVLDAFCGCGTTLAVARKLNRQFIGIDLSPTACRVIAERIKYPIQDIIGLPLTIEEVSNLTGYEFQNAVIRLIDPSLKNIEIGNKGADGGIDGKFYNVPISVKKYKAGRKDLDEFVATIYRNKKKIGIFIALEFSSDFTKEVARLKREDRLEITAFTLQDLIDKKQMQFATDLNKFVY